MNWLTKCRRNWRIYRRIHGLSRYIFRGKSASIGINLSPRFDLHEWDEDDVEGWQNALIGAIDKMGPVPVYLWAGLKLDSELVTKLSRLAFRLDCSVHLIGQGPQLSTKQIEDIILSGVESFSCTIAAKDNDLHQRVEQGKPIDLVNLARDIKEASRTFNRTINTVVRIPWHYETASSATETLEWLSQQYFDKIELVPSFFASDAASDNELLAQIERSGLHQTPIKRIEYLGFQFDSEDKPGIPRTNGTCQVARHITLIRPDGSTAHCPFKAWSTDENGVSVHLKDIKSCQRHCHHPDVMPFEA
ncbi:MAG: hypothetical protein ACON4U_07290 [Myxococcota bacterium]